ncbi:MAG: HlyD family efflux transporter periplasmic adaptor subunit [Eubacteriales bacterium]|nr:HlyD family efflux transporter periplasmic adaptor subunit [Eubacteriales bacterium]
MKGKKAWIIAGIAVVICAAGGLGFLLLRQKDNAPDEPALPEGMTVSENVVSAAGLTSVGMMEEVCELGFLENGLYVEETYLNMGDEVEAHTPVFKVSEESLENARRELEKSVQETALNRRQGEITYQTGLVEAQKEKDLAAVEAQYAQAVYDSAVKTAQEKVDESQEAVDSAQEKVDEYTASIESDYYYTYYEVEELEATWKDNAAFLMELYNNWNVAALEDIYGGSGGKNGIGYVTNQVTGTASGSASGVSSGGSAADISGQAASVAGGQEVSDGVFFAVEQAVGSTEENADKDTGNAVGAAEGGTGDTETGVGVEEGGTGDTKEDVSAADDGSGDGKNEGAGEKELPDMAGMQPGGGGGSISGNDIDRMGQSSVNISDDEIRYNIYLAMVEETEESEDAYEAALEKYEEAKEKAAAGIAEAKSELAVLQAKLKEQQSAYEEAVISAKLTYDLAVSDNETAEMVYETTVKQLEEDYDALVEEEETAAQNLELFEETVGDGIFYTGSGGTVMMTAVRANSWITEDTMVMAYSNPETVTVAASVDQADIASIEIGGQACIVISGYGTYTGKVTSLNPVSASGGSSGVTYTVNVLLEGDVSELEANLTAYVYFGLTEEEKEMMSGSSGKGGQMEMDGGPMDGDGGPDMPGGRQGGME